MKSSLSKDLLEYLDVEMDGTGVTAAWQCAFFEDVFLKQGQTSVTTNTMHFEYNPENGKVVVGDIFCLSEPCEIRIGDLLHLISTRYS